MGDIEVTRILVKGDEKKNKLEKGNESWNGDRWMEKDSMKGKAKLND